MTTAPGVRWDTATVRSLSRANLALGCLDGTVSARSDSGPFVAMCARSERAHGAVGEHRDDAIAVSEEGHAFWSAHRAEIERAARAAADQADA